MGLFFVAAMLLFPAARVWAATYEIDAAHSSVGFRIRHLMSRVNGSFGSFSGTIEFDEKQPTKGRVTATIDAASIDTNNDRRDEHLRSADFFDVTKYPT
ncbi:MAG: YceI family protein, partial [Armatimonadota bacterium]|nr:YceI family protein [Armatimonadota bacterium]